MFLHACRVRLKAFYAACNDCIYRVLPLAGIETA
jgi:hypothetical protein